MTSALTCFFSVPTCLFLSPFSPIISNTFSVGMGFQIHNVPAWLYQKATKLRLMVLTNSPDTRIRPSSASLDRLFALMHFLPFILNPVTFSTFYFTQFLAVSKKAPSFCLIIFKRYKKKKIDGSTVLIKGITGTMSFYRQSIELDINING